MEYIQTDTPSTWEREINFCLDAKISKFILNTAHVIIINIIPEALWLEQSSVLCMHCCVTPLPLSEKIEKKKIHVTHHFTLQG